MENNDVFLITKKNKCLIKDIEMKSRLDIKINKEIYMKIKIIEKFESDLMLKDIVEDALKFYIDRYCQNNKKE